VYGPLGHSSDCVPFDSDGTLFSAEYSERFDYEAAAVASKSLDTPPQKARILLKEKKSRYGTLKGTLTSPNIHPEDFFKELANQMDTER